MSAVCERVCCDKDGREDNGDKAKGMSEPVAEIGVFVRDEEDDDVDDAEDAEDGVYDSEEAYGRKFETVGDCGVTTGEAWLGMIVSGRGASCAGD